MNSDDHQRAGALRVILTDGLGRPLRDPGIRGWLERVAPASARGRMGVALVSDAGIRRLNRAFAGRDRATDVLSFRAEDAPALPGRAGAASGAPWLGDVVIATGVARRQADAAGHAYRTELRTLALHGLLHLLGYDHERDGGAMARVERRLRRAGGLPTGLIERAASPARRARS